MDLGPLLQAARACRAVLGEVVGPGRVQPEHGVAVAGRPLEQVLPLAEVTVPGGKQELARWGWGGGVGGAAQGGPLSGRWYSTGRSVASMMMLPVCTCSVQMKLIPQGDVCAAALCSVQVHLFLQHRFNVRVQRGQGIQARIVRLERRRESALLEALDAIL